MPSGRFSGGKQALWTVEGYNKLKEVVIVAAERKLTVEVAPFAAVLTAAAAQSTAAPGAFQTVVDLHGTVLVSIR